MKLFLSVLLAATIVGGYAGAEFFDTSFSIMGAVIGGVGTAAVLLGLGAYFDAQDRKSKKLSPEMLAFFDRMITDKENPTEQEILAAKKEFLKGASQIKEKELGQTSMGKLQATFVPRRTQQKMPPIPSAKMLRGAGLPPLLADSLQNLMAQDAEAIARGEVLERRLIPHHAIKRDIIITAYTRDFEQAKQNVKDMAGQDYQKGSRIRMMGDNFENLIAGIKQLSWQELDEIINRMKGGRADMQEIEQEVRLKKPMYKIVDPIFG